MRIEFRIDGRNVTVEASGTITVQVTEEKEPTRDGFPEGLACRSRGLFQAEDIPEIKDIPEVTAQGTVDSEVLFQKLSELRRGLAAEAGVPPFVVFNDNTLIEMTEKRPKDMTELSAIKGVGKLKLEKYGKRFLAVIKEE